MQFNTALLLSGTALALSGLSTGAAIIEDRAAAAKTWAFRVHQSTNCADANPALQPSGTGSTQYCSGPFEYYFASVLVTNNSGGNCTISFGQDNVNSKCTNIVAKSPGDITQGKCYNFKSPATTKTYSVVCK